MMINKIALPSTRPPGFLLLADTPALGMKMMTTQVVRELRHAYPQSRVGVLTSGRGSAFYRSSPYDLIIHEINAAEGFRNPEKYDVVVSLPFQEGGYADLVINKRIYFPETIGSNSMLSALLFRHSEDVFDRYRFDHDVNSPHNIEEPEEYMGKAMLRYLEPLGITTDDMRPEAWACAKDTARIGSMFEARGISRGDFVVVLNLSANQGQNQWRMQTLAETASIMDSYWSSLRFCDTYGRLVFLANYYAPAQEKFFGRFMTAIGQFSARPAVIGMPNTSPGELASILARSSYVITTETGTAHVAQALDVPATVVYGTERVKNGWMLPGSRVIPIVSDIYNVSSDDIATGSLSGIAEWSRK